MIPFLAEFIDASTITIFPWAPGGDFASHWQQGLALASIGGAGALVTLYFFAGSFLPSMGGKAVHDSLAFDLGALKDRRDVDYQSWRAAVASRAPETEIASLHDLCLAEDGRVSLDSRSLERERWRLILIGSFLYLVLGAFFAALVADNYLQALAVGFGWTAVAERMGLRQKEDVKNVAITSALKDEQAKTAAAVRERDAYRENSKFLTDLLATPSSQPSTPPNSPALDSTGSAGGPEPADQADTSGDNPDDKPDSTSQT